MKPSASAAAEFRRAYRRAVEAQYRLRRAEARILRALGGNWDASSRWRHREMDRVEREMAK